MSKRDIVTEVVCLWRVFYKKVPLSRIGAVSGEEGTMRRMIEFGREERGFGPLSSLLSARLSGCCTTIFGRYFQLWHGLQDVLGAACGALPDGLLTIEF